MGDRGERDERDAAVKQPCRPGRGAARSGAPRTRDPEPEETRQSRPILLGVPALRFASAGTTSEGVWAMRRGNEGDDLSHPLRGTLRRRATSPTVALPAPSSPSPMPDRILLPLIVACALFMENLNSTVLSTSLPAIASGFRRSSPIHLKLALTSYLLAIAVFLPASGWLADRYGARTIFRLAIVVFTLGSIVCGLSSSIARDRRGARRPGDRRGDDGAGRPAGHPQERRQARARRLARLADRAGADRAGHRPAARRLHHHLFRLALDLLDQRAGRDPRPGARDALHSRHSRRDARPLRHERLRPLRPRARPPDDRIDHTRPRPAAAAGRGLAFLAGGAPSSSATSAQPARTPTPIIDLSLFRIPTFVHQHRSARCSSASASARRPSCCPSSSRSASA